MKTLPRVTMIAAAILATWCDPQAVCRAEIVSVSITPAHPTDHDTIRFSLAGRFSDGCWSADNFTFLRIAPTQFSASVSAVDTWEPGRYCLAFIVEYAFGATFGPLAPGNYSISVIESHESMREPQPDMTSLNFAVTLTLPAVTNLTALASGGDVGLRWSPVTGATGYRIYRAPDATFFPSPAYLLDSARTPGYTDTSLTQSPAARAFYLVTATN